MDTTLIRRDSIPTTLSVMEAPRPAIPTEVVEQIIDMVAEVKHRFDKEEVELRTYSLYACSLVARSWVPRSRLHLYPFVELSSDRKTRRFLNSLAQSPALGQFVETLQIRPHDEDERTCGWIFKALTTLPPLLPNLRELVLCELPDLRQECIAVLSRFRTVESPVLYDLRKQSLREIVLLISRFPHLRRLYVVYCTWKLPGRYYSGKQHNLTALHAHPYSDCDASFLEWALASKSTSGLTAFRAYSNVAGSGMDRVLQSCCSTLREVHLDLFRYEGEWLWMPFSPMLTCSLRISLAHKPPQTATSGLSLPLIFSELARLPTFAPKSLVGVCAAAWYGLEDIPESQWEAIDLALCNTQFPHLKSAEFTDSPGNPLQNPHEFFQRALPKSYERGIIWLRHDHRGTYLIAIMPPPSDLRRPTYSHCSEGCPAIPRTTSRMG